MVVWDVASCNPMGADVSVVTVTSMYIVEYLLYLKDVDVRLVRNVASLLQTVCRLDDSC
jgi:hypothetical protein